MNVFLLIVLWVGFNVFATYAKKKKQAEQQRRFRQQSHLTQQPRQPQVTRPQPHSLEEMMEQFVRKLNAAEKKPKSRTTRLSDNALMNQQMAMPAVADDMDIPDMESESMHPEDMTSESMDAEPMVAEQLVDPDAVVDFSTGVLEEEDHLQGNKVYNPWNENITAKDIRRGFIMAQVLGKPRSMEPYRGQQ